MKSLFYTFLLLMINYSSDGQNYFIHKEDRTVTVFSLNKTKAYVGTNFCNVNLFIDEVNYNSNYTIVGYTYLGIDSDYNIHIEMKISVPIIDKSDSKVLVFRSEKGHAKITLPNDSS